METIKNYRSLIRDVLIERKKKNPQYSLRSFAKSLGIKAPFLSLILSGKRDLSEAMIQQFAERLQFSHQETQTFELLVRLEKADQGNQKKRILEQLQNIDPSFSLKRDLTIEHFRIISEWHHFAILSLIEIKDFKWSSANVAKTLGISSFEVDQALERLASLELVQMEPGQRPTKTDTRFAVSSEHHQDAIKKYHLQMLEKISAAQIEQTPKERFTGTENITLSPDQLKEANQILEECLQKLVNLSKKKKTNAEVYHAGLHLIRLTNIKGVKK